MGDEPDPEARKALGETTAHLGMLALQTTESAILFAVAGLAFVGGLVAATFAAYHGVAAWQDRPKGGRG